MLTKVIDQAKIDRFSKWLGHAEKIVIVAHVAPDGDAIGSSLGLWHFFNSQEKTANIIVPNAFPDFLKWMPGSKDVLLYDRYKEFADKLIAEAEIICCLDFNALSRIDAMADAVRAAKGKKILVDHHLYPEEFCDIIISHPNISSTSELVFRLICRMGYFNEITKQGAECIYTGMMTDTGGFTYNSNNREIYFIISELLSKGIDKDEIYRKVYNTYSESRLRLMGHILSADEGLSRPPCRPDYADQGRAETLQLHSGRQRRICKYSFEHKECCFLLFPARRHRETDDQGFITFGRHIPLQPSCFRIFQRGRASECFRR